MFQSTDPRILRGPKSRPRSWPLLNFSHDDSRLYNICRKKNTSIRRGDSFKPPTEHRGSSTLYRGNFPEPRQALRHLRSHHKAHSLTMSPSATQGLQILVHILFFCIILHILFFSSSSQLFIIHTIDSVVLNILFSVYNELLFTHFKSGGKIINSA